MKRGVRQRPRTWTKDRATGLWVFTCGCGVRIAGIGDPKTWADHHICEYGGFSNWGGIKR